MVGVLLVMLILMLVVSFRNDQQFSSIFHVFPTGFAICAAQRFASFPVTHVWRCLELTFWLSVGGIVSALVVYWGQPELLGNLIPGSSTNGLPSYLIIPQIAFSVVVFLERKRLPLLSATATFLVVVAGVGCGSITVALLIVLVSGAVHVRALLLDRRGGVDVRYLFAIAGTALLGVAYVLLETQSLVTWFSQTKWAWGPMDPPRAHMVRDYLARLDVFSILVGADYAGTAIDEFYGGNPHNSYIRIRPHSFFGLPGVLLVLISPAMIFLSRREVFSRIVVGVLVLLALVRAITEPLFFPTALVFLFSVFFIVLEACANSSKSCVRSPDVSLSAIKTH
ncbi:hypothetical protein [Propionivibrio soli]|uniref:hypothetical protein n=1 Tax=Propionivibrio soli TaxID=2976531 RepID=UPI0021E95EDE|nr:hypothetical protein [Propionivibrio soli]